MHRPVDAAGLAELPRAVERVDDPDAIGVETARVLQPFLRQHGVVGAMESEFLGQELLGSGVAGVLDVPRGRARGEHLRAQLEEQHARPGSPAA